MAIYSIEDGHVGRVFDAHGREIHFTTRVDTETGTVSQLVREGDGYKLNAAGDAVFVQRARYAAPLRYVPRGEQPDFEIPPEPAAPLCNHDWRERKYGKWCATCGEKLIIGNETAPTPS